LIAMFAVNKGAKALAEKIAPMVVTPPAPTPAPPGAPPAPTSVMPDFNFTGFKNPELDEEWRAPPPPTTPADHLDPSREEIAHEREAAKAEPK
jgi:hypothetical protein